jgi:DNA-directed RNA polymerase subunit RPC12/RpoP
MLCSQCGKESGYKKTQNRPTNEGTFPCKHCDHQILLRDYAIFLFDNYDYNKGLTKNLAYDNRVTDPQGKRQLVLFDETLLECQDCKGFAFRLDNGYIPVIVWCQNPKCSAKGTKQLDSRTLYRHQDRSLSSPENPYKKVSFHSLDKASRHRDKC